jgi:uncharacterized coiled-coil DUF342 family protein
MAKHKHGGEADGASSAAGGVAAVAMEIEAELRRLEDLAGAVKRAPLRSQKDVERAAGMVGQVTDHRVRFGAQLQALMAALAVARDRHEAAEQAIQRRAVEIQERAAEMTALLERLAELGQEATEIGALARSIGAPGQEAPAEDVVAEVQAIRERTGSLVARADALLKDAQAADLIEVARQADSLRQTVAAAHNKIAQLQRSLSAGEPPPPQRVC